MTAIKPDPVPTEAKGIERNVRDGISRMPVHGSDSMEFPANPWRAADGGVAVVHDCSVHPESAPDKHPDPGGVCVNSHTDEGVSN